MKKVLIHKNSGNPVYIARAEGGVFHIIYRDRLMGSHDSIGKAIAVATAQFVVRTPSEFDDWLSYL